MQMRTSAVIKRDRVIINILPIIIAVILFVVILSIVKAKIKRNAEIKDLFNIRMTEHKDYFASHTKIQGVYNFMKKIVDNLPS